MKFFLHLRHWHIFLLFFVLPFVFQTVYEQAMGDNLYVLLVFNAIFIFLALAYLWTLGMALYEKNTQEISTLKPAIFKLGLVYAFFELTYLFTFANGLILSYAKAPLILIPVHMLAMLAVFYAFYFIAKNLGDVTYKKDSDINDWVGWFFALWFYPIGIWFLQPKINEVFR